MDATRFMAGPLLGVDSTHGDNGRNRVGAQGNGGTTGFRPQEIGGSALLAPLPPPLTAPFDLADIKESGSMIARKDSASASRNLAADSARIELP
jgi:hypothetical protein